jgi:hypothetical protein
METTATATHEGEGPGDLMQARRQRDQALACAFLSAIITLAVLLSNFGREPEAILTARAAVQKHKQLLAQNEEVLRANQAVLAQNQADLEKLRQALRPRVP